jgi:hypothetical protein
VFGTAKLWAGGAVLVAVGLSVFLGYRHYTGMVEDLADLRERKVELEGAVAQRDQAIQTYAAAVVKWQEANDTLRKRAEAAGKIAQWAQGETRRLNELLAEHDLAALARAKPGLLESRLNSGSARALRLLHCASSTEPAADCPAAPEQPGAAGAGADTDAAGGVVGGDPGTPPGG